MFTCDNPTCTGHLGKFRDCTTEALYSMEADRTAGTVEFQGHFSLFRITPEESRRVKEDLEATIPAGTYIVTEDEQGFVESKFWPEINMITDDEPNEIMDAVDVDYSRWADAQEADV